jgi:hypothetical protein
LTDDELTAALYGEAAPQVQAHLEQCADCAARMKDVRRFESALKSTFSRTNCPTPDGLGDYLMGFLDENEQQIVSSHLQICRYCQADVKELRRFINAPDVEPAPAPAPGFGESLRRLIAQLLPQQPALAVRGVKRSRQFLGGVEGMNIFLEVEADDGNLVLTGQILAADGTPWAGGLLEIRRDSEIQTVVTLDEMGEYRCESVPPGNYELRFTGGNGYQIVVENFALNSP